MLVRKACNIKEPTFFFNGEPNFSDLEIINSLMDKTDNANLYYKKQNRHTNKIFFYHYKIPKTLN